MIIIFTFIFVLAAAIAVLGLAVGIGLVARDTRRRAGKWGINTQSAGCPRCNAAMPAVRMPRTFQQAMWGGWTCACGCEIDKWGREIT